MAKQNRACEKPRRHATIVTGNKGGRGMRRKLGLAAGLLLIATALPVSAQKIAGLDGDWNGALATPSGVTLHLHLQVVSSATATMATMFSVDQGNAAIPVPTLTRKGNAVRLDMPLVHASFKGMLKGGTLVGTFTQGADLPLTLTRAAAAAPLKKKQARQHRGE